MMSLKQKPLDIGLVKQTVMDLLPKKKFDIIITHSRSGEYTRHLRKRRNRNCLPRFVSQRQIVRGAAFGLCL